MKKWTYGANGIHKEAHIVVDQAPWWAFLIEFLVGTVCAILHIVPFFSSWITTDWFHLYIHSPVTHWVDRRTRTAYINVDYEHLKERMKPFNPKYWEEQIAFEEETCEFCDTPKDSPNFAYHVCSGRKTP